MKVTITVACVFGVLSVITMLLYAIDKSRAIKQKWRIPEKVLLGFSLFGGGIGGYVAMFVTHHKTKKWYFHFINILGIALQVGLIVVLLIYKL